MKISLFQLILLVISFFVLFQSKFQIVKKLYSLIHQFFQRKNKPNSN